MEHLGLPELEKKEIRKEKQPGTYDREGPEKKFLLFHHSQIDKKEPKAIKGMEDKYEEEQDVKSSALMKV